MATTRTRRTLRAMGGIVVALLIAGVAALVPARPAAAEQKTVTVELFSVLQLENPDGDGSQGDYFARVKIDDGPEESSPRVEDDDFAVDWKFTRTVESSPGRIIPVTIRLIDFDSFAAGDDDIMDISPNNQDVELNLLYSLDSGTWSGDVNLGKAEGDGDHDFPEVNDGRRARILFDITTAGSTDIDGDGIPNTVERFGVTLADGTQFLTGLDPCRKTILLQLDFMTGAADGHSHAPKQDARDEVVAAFDNAPVDSIDPCPFGGPARPDGIGFTFIPGKSVTERPVMAFDANYRAARAANFDPALRPYAHYGIAVHDQAAGSSSSGLCCEKEQGSKDILVSLGSWRTTCVAPGANGTLDTSTAGDDLVSGMSIMVGANRNCDTTKVGDDVQVLTVGTGAANAFVGTVRDQSGTIMHELGHALGLGHGGNDPTNHKPNYLSVMNYAFDPGGIDIDGAGGTRLDYSPDDLPDLDKSRLSETDGIRDGTDFTHWTHASGDQWGRGDGPLNWNGNKADDGTDIIDPGTVASDINTGDDVCILPGGNGEIDTDPEGDDRKVGGARPAILSGGDGVCQTTEDDDDDTGPANVLTGYDDWANLQFRAIAAVAGAGVAADHGGDITFPVVLQRELARDAFFDPDLAPTKTVDKADAQPGEALAYSVEIRNVGTGTATAVRLTDTFPDGTTATRTPADIAPGRSRTESFTYTVPCSTDDGAVLTNRASVTATDLGQSPESNTANNASAAATTVHAPKLTLGKTTSQTVLAGEAITTELTISNVGSGGATDVAVTDTLPADLYYSQALDLGAGPRPTSVVENPDGTTTLSWSLGTLAGAASTTIEYTARPSLLVLGGTRLINQASVSYRTASGCEFAPVDASATTTVIETPPTEDPLSAGYWMTHQADRTDELRARIQATDQRYDGIDGTAPDGALSNPEAQAALAAGGSQPGELRRQELAVLFDLASRRINASTLIDGRLADRLGTSNVREAVLHGIATLALPVSKATANRYSDATTLLDQIATDRIEVY